MVDSVGIEDIRLCHHSDGRKVLGAGSRRGEMENSYHVRDDGASNSQTRSNPALLGRTCARIWTRSSERRNDALVMIRTGSRIA